MKEDADYLIAIFAPIMAILFCLFRCIETEVGTGWKP